jgi:outer membrane protein TolC
MKQQTIIIILLLLITAIAKGQEPLRLSLSEAQDYAIEHNKTLQNAKLDLKVSDLKIKETIAQGLPQVDAGLDFSTYFGYKLDFPLGGGGGDQTTYTPEQYEQAWNTALGVYPSFTQEDLMKYMAGATYSGKLQSFTPMVINMRDQLNAKVQIGQLLFNGQYWVGIQTAKLGKKIAEQGIDNSILDVKQNLANSYFMVLVTQKSLEIFEQNIVDLRKIENHTRKMVETGIAEQTSLDQITVQVTMLENTKKTMERAVRMGYNLLKFQLGVNPKTEIVLTDSFDKLLSENAASQALTESFNIENNILYQMTETSQKITEKMVKMEQMAYAPTLTGFYAYNQKFFKTDFDMTPKHIAGVSMSIPVFSSGSRKYKVSQAKIKLEQAQVNKSMVEDQLTMQEQQLKLDLNSALENYDLQKENVNVAKRVFESVNRKFEQGMVSSLELTQTNSSYLQAETNFVQASFALIQARLALDKLYNKL